MSFIERLTKVNTMRNKQCEVRICLCEHIREEVSLSTVIIQNIFLS